jgi:hypothetical protein
LGELPGGKNGKAEYLRSKQGVSVSSARPEATNLVAIERGIIFDVKAGLRGDCCGIVWRYLMMFHSEGVTPNASWYGNIGKSEFASFLRKDSC